MQSAWVSRWIEVHPAVAPGRGRFNAAPVRLFSEGLGDPAQPVVLLVMGAMNQGIVWPEAFCEEIASAGFCVVRYDHRDTGQSQVGPYALQPYDVDDLTADALAVAQAWAGPRRVHWIGMSMGGTLAQLAALGQADKHMAARVASLTLIMSTPDLSVPARASTGTPQYPPSDLPPPAPAYLEHMGRASREFAHTPQATLDKLVDGWRAANGNAAGFDSIATRALVQRTLARTSQPLAALNHVAASLSARDLSAALARLRVPTLIVHGADDPLVPPAHGAALARLIPGAVLLEVPEMGHMFDARHLAQVTPRVIMHLQNALRVSYESLLSETRLP